MKADSAIFSQLMRAFCANTRAMKRIGLLVLLAGLACANPAPDEENEAEPPPIGPGSDSTALMPPDTPESRVNPADTGRNAQRR